MIDFKNVNSFVGDLHIPYQQVGKLIKVSGLILECVGLSVSIGSVVKIILNNSSWVYAEVIGFENKKTFLMLESSDTHGLKIGLEVYFIGTKRHFPLGKQMLGRVVNGIGHPLDEGDYLLETEFIPPIINPLKRKPVNERLDVGVSAINNFLSVGVGQRMGIFAGSGVGKSVLIGMLARFTAADVVVVGLIGERGREVQEFLHNSLGKDGLKKSVVVVATADETPIMRIQAAEYTVLLAEHFRSLGNNVLLLMDSLTRYAMAKRELALALGEPPATRGYPPSVFASIPSLLERAGNSDVGSITGFYTVLSEGDDLQDPITDTARGVLDGHIVLTRKLAEAGHFPAIDLGASISRVMPHIVSQEDLKIAYHWKKLWSVYQENIDLIQIGAYNKGSNPILDEAIQKHSDLENILCQSMNERRPL